MISTMLSMVRLCVSVHHKSDIITAKPITFTGEIYLAEVPRLNMIGLKYVYI